VLDYDDLLLFWRGLLADPGGGARVRETLRPRAGRRVPGCNALQADIVLLLRPDGTGVTCVGDDAEAIDGFRAATVRNILDFEQRFTGAEVRTLTRNYRSAAAIVTATTPSPARPASAATRSSGPSAGTAAGRCLPPAATRTTQTRRVCDHILDHREQGTELKKQAVLFRAQHHSMALEMELSRRNVPFRSTGACA